MCASNLLFRISTLRPILLTLTLLGGCRTLIAEPGDERLVANSNQTPAGRFAEGQLTIRLEAAMGEWYPEENDGPALKVAAFREEGRPLPTPGPLLPRPRGTDVNPPR